MKNFIPILVTSINSFIFLSIVILTLYQSIKYRNVLSLILYGSFFSSISWHVLATTHSLNHIHLNFICWYLFFVPFAVFYFFEAKNFSKTINNP